MTAEAIRVALPRRLAVARRPPGPADRSGTASSAAPALTISGPSRETAPASTTTARKVTGVEAGSVRSVLSTATRTTPAASSSAPATSRAHAGRLRSTAASASASAGRMRATRRAVIRAAAQAPSRLAPTAAIIGKIPAVRSRVTGTTPASTNRPCSQAASGSPARAPATPAASPTSSASRPIMLRSCPGVAAMARSRASSRWRCWIDREKVPTTTRTATRSEVPPIAPPMETSLIRAPAASRNSTGPRSSPVATCAVVPWSACRIRAAGQLAGVHSGPGQHPDGADPACAGGEPLRLGVAEEQRALVREAPAGRGGDPADRVGLGRAGGLHGECGAGLQGRAGGESTVDDDLVTALGRTAFGEREGGERGRAPGVPVRGLRAFVARSALGERHGLEGELGDGPLDSGHRADGVHGGRRQPGPFGDGLGLVLRLDLRPVALLLHLDRRRVDVLVGGDDHRGARVALGGDRPAQSRLQEGSAGGDEGRCAQQGEEGAEETGFGVSDGPECVAQHHGEDSVPPGPPRDIGAPRRPRPGANPTHSTPA